MRTNPRPTPESIGVYYPSNYGPYQEAENASIDITEGLKVNPFGIKNKVKRLLGLGIRTLPLAPPGHLLEIGSASGSYLMQMKQKGWQVEGIEFSTAAAKRAQAKGLLVQVATVEPASAPQNLVDIVVAWMVLEHLHDPVGALVKIKSWGKPGGYLVASIPDSSSLIRHFFGELSYDLQLPTHLYHFTPSSLENLLNHCGWHLVHVYWQRNCNTLLWSAEYLCREKRYYKLERFIFWLRTAKRPGKIRLLLSWILGVTKQSGRLEIWARPIDNNSTL